MKKKKIELLRKIMLYLKYDISYIGLKSKISSPQKRFPPRISFWNRVSSGFFCLGEKEKGKRESRINENRKNLIRQLGIQRVRAGDFFPKISEKIVKKIPGILGEKFNRSSINSYPNFPKFLFYRTLLFKLRFGADSQVSCMILDNYLEQVPYYNWPIFFKDIIETKVLSEILCKTFILSFIFFKFVKYFLKPEKIENFIAQTELILETFFSRKKNNLSYKLFPAQTNEFVFWNFKKVQFCLIEFYIKNFPLIKWIKKNKVNCTNPFFEYLKKGKDSKLSEICIRKKCNYIDFEEFKTIFLIIGNITNNEKYYETIDMNCSKKDARTKYFLSLLFYKKKNFTSSQKQLDFLLKQNLLKGKVHFLSGLISNKRNNFQKSLKFFSWIIKRHPFNRKTWGVISLILSKIPLKENGIIIAFKKQIHVQDVPPEVSETVLIHFLKTKEVGMPEFLEIIDYFLNTHSNGGFPSLIFFTKILNWFVDHFQKKIQVFCPSKKEKNQIIKIFFFLFKKKSFLKKILFFTGKQRFKNENNIFNILTEKQNFFFPGRLSERKKSIYIQFKNNELEILNRISLPIKNC